MRDRWLYSPLVPVVVKLASITCLSLLVALTPNWRTFAQSPEEEDVVYVRYVVNANYVYHIPYEALSKPQEVLTRGLIVRNHDTISSIVSRIYGVGSSNAPQAYRAFEEFIETANDIADPNLIELGQTLSVPDLPRIALQQPNPANPYNALPKFGLSCGEFNTSLCDPLAAASPHAVAAMKTDGTYSKYLSDQNRKVSQTVFEVRAVTAKKAAELLENPFYEVEAARIDIKFAGEEDGGNFGEFIPEVQQELIRTSLGGTP